MSPLTWEGLEVTQWAGAAQLVDGRAGFEPREAEKPGRGGAGGPAIGVFQQVPKVMPIWGVSP